MANSIYPSDLSDSQWSLIEPLIPPAAPGGRPRKVDMRAVINGILYLNRSGCSWRMLPKEFPPWGTVHYYYRRFRLDGTWSRIHDTLRERVRRQAGRKPTPSTGVLDSQTVKTAAPVQKKGSRDMTLARKPLAGSDICASTPWV